ncbi:MAG: amino acid adenylation domain-containing protein, partial [Longimicrobiaceae bacterium]
MNSGAALTELTLAQRRELLKMARARDLVRDRSELPPIERAPRDERLPLSFAQQGLWFVEQLGNLGATYHVPLRLRMRGELHRDALARALDGIVARHEALRTTFTQVDGIPEQRIAPAEADGLPLAEHDLAGRPDPEAELGRLMAGEAHAPFDLERGPLVRGRLVRLAADDHVLLLTMHHIVADGWSMRVLLGELAARYAAHHEGREAALPELPVQYADYAAWQRRWVEGEVLREQAAYWTRTLGGAPELLELPTDHPRPAQVDHAGASLRVELDEALTTGLKALSRRHGTTLFMTLLAGWAAVLGRLSGQDDVVVGTPTAGRGRPEIEGLIGFFVNTLALRVELSGSPTVAELLARVRERALAAQQHQDIPFEQVVNLVDPARSLSHTPLFQVVFAWVNTPLGAGISLPGLELDAAITGASQAKFDLSLTLQEAGDRIAGGVEYATALFERATVERFLGCLRRVLEAMAEDERQAVDRQPLLSPAERRQAVEGWNATEAEYPGRSCVHELFERQVERAPGATAVRSGDERLSYAELNARANRLAHHLRALGVGPEVRVALCVERGPGMVAAVLAVLKAGGAYVPLDPAYPRDRLAYMLADSAPAVVLTQGAVAEALAGVLDGPGGGVPVLELDAAAPAWAPRRDTNPARGGLTPEHPAYLIYTSGSTGLPKGVLVPHRGLCNVAAAQQRAFGVGPDDRVLQFASLSFDAAAFELVMALASGAALCVAPREELIPGPGLLALLRAHAVTTVTLPPSALAALPVEELPALRTITVAGEALPAELAARWGARHRLWNLYGPTEATIWSTAAECADPARRPDIGGPVANVRAYVLDAGLEPLPVGAAGELYVGGAGVARGYLGRPGLTAERFVPDPFGGAPGARLYRTGDRARRLADGRLDFIGRMDHQVKVRGFRIEPGEIEARLAEDPAVREAVVLAREDPAFGMPGEKRLVAYVVGEARAEALRARLRQSLPEHMVPAAFVFLERLPLTPNGKLDRRALPAPELASAEDRYVAPRTPVEDVLAGIWAETLRLERVGVEDGFFELGGHSLLATRVVSRVRDLFGVELPLRALFEGPTVAELAGRVEEIRRAELPVLPPVVPVERAGPLPLSFAQERLWFIDRMEPGSAAYNIPVARRLWGGLDVAALRRALGEIVRRHETLRTVFAEVDGSPVQVIAPSGGFALPVEDLSALGEADREASLRRRAGEEARRAFDLAAGPLFRAALLRLGAEDHVLLLSMHHIVSDGWSMGVLFRELSALYAAYREGGESPLAEPGVQYADFAVWQREQLAGEALDRQLAYWRERLAGAPELLELPTDHPRPAVQTSRGAHERIELPGELLERLRALGRSGGATLYMVLLGAFQALLSRYSGSEDVVVGSPIAGRTRKEVEELIGFFVNTLVLRVDLGGDPGFREVLGRAREATLGAYENQEVPFEKLVAELQPQRSLTHSPLFQVLFTVQNAEGPGNALAGLEVGGAGPAMEIAKFDLSLALAATPRGLRGGLNYSTALFDRGTALRMLGHLARVLEQVAADADVRLSRLELLGEAERALVLDGWNRTAAGYPADRCIHELFEAQAARAPGAVAVRFEEESLTYRELNERANRLAHHLRGLGVGPDARVGVCVERGPAMIAGLLAILKAGGAYVPLDPAYPADRLRYMLEDSAPAALVTQSSLAGAFAGLDVPAVHLDAPAPAWAEEPATNPACAGLTPDNLAYVVYTSGSTGRPKGVMVEHRSLVNHTAWQAAAFGIGAPDTVLQRTSISFDASAWELWTPLAAGARMLLLSSAAARDPGAIARAMAEAGVTVAQFVPLLLQAVLGARPADTPLPCRILFCGGEPLPAALVEEARSAGVGEVVNLYGPTEATVDSTSYPCPAGDGRAPSIGRPIANARVYVLDARGEPAPVGVAGELYVGGAGVARGYLGRAGLTAERFVPDPFLPGAGARLYRTGDLGRWRADGTLEFLGRTDFQVKVRGFRIEPGEIEAALLEHEGVRECAVLAREDAPGEKRLVAYVAGDARAEALRAHARRSLPEHMVPAAFVFLDALPLTPSGKLDRRALPAPDLASAEERHVAPRTPVEEVLAGIWAETLRLERVGVEDGFFELGGHSLLATRVVSRVRELFGVELPLRALFEGPTVAELAGRVEEIRRAELPVLPPVVPVERAGPLPLSFAQERLWFIDRMEPGSAAYNIPVARRLGGALDVAALERALGEIVRRHETLRTTFADADGSPVQVIAPSGGFALPVEDLSAAGEADREAALGRRAGDEARRAFDLSAGPLFRAALLRLGAGDHVLLLSMHHIVSDGWSMGVLFRELSTLYAAYREGLESPLPEPGVQYADYAVWQREQLAGEALERQLAYWRERLAGAPELLELPTDHPRPAVQSFRGADERVQLPPEVLERLRALGRREGATLYMVALGAFQALLSRYSGSEDVVVGSPVAGRGRGEVEGLIGFFVNTMVLRTDLSGDPSFRELVGRVRRVTLGAYEHQEVPFERLVAELSPERSLSHSPLFQVAFTLNDAQATGGGLAGLSVQGVGTELEIAKFDLSLGLAATPGGLLGGLNYGTALWEAATMRRLVGHFTRLVEQAAADPDARISQATLMGEAERRQVVEEWNRTAVEHPTGALIHELVAAQAARAPRALAVVCGEEALTYAELDARADRLARRLVGLGAGPEVRVGICLERSAGMVVALLAVLKAGAAFVPLDPAYPADRLSYMLADSGARVLVTQASLRGLLPADGVRTVLADADAAAPDAAPRTAAAPENAAYVIYTSGSTGRPKGVVVTHGALLNLVHWHREAFAVTGADRATQLAGLGFDASVWELWPYLAVGAAVHLAADEETRTSPAALRSFLLGRRITVAFAPTPLAEALLALEWPAEAPLRLLLTGGDALRARPRAALPFALVNNYGPTENAVVTTSGVVGAGQGSGRAPGIGRPIHNVRAYVLDRRLEPVPAGVPGELCVGGAQVARGYLGRAELTAGSFVPDPFSGRAGARMYRTGDRARWLADGTLEFLGRLDRQAKVRGFRVEPGEVEAVLRQAPGVGDAVVEAREDARGERRLVGYVVAPETMRAEIVAFARTWLPEYMVPAALVMLERLPLTPSGKVDRRALPEPDAAGDADAAPATPAEEVVAGIWVEVLGVGSVGARQSFFALGGHSLLAAQVVSRVRRVFGVELPLRAVFEAPTVRELAARVEHARRDGADDPAPPIRPVERGEPLPLSFGQERLWLLDQMHPGDGVYTIPVALHLAGALDADALRGALEDIVRRHEALRTVFGRDGDHPVQVVLPPSAFELAVADLSGVPGEARTAALDARARAEALRPFDLGAGPLFRALLLRAAEDEHVLVLAMHHAASDGWSMDVLFRELGVLYAARLRGEASPLPALPLRYADYAAWQREWLTGEALERQLDGWKARLAAAPALLDLPTDRPRPAVQSFRGATHDFRVPEETAGALRILARREGATPFMALLAAWQLVLARWSGQDDVVVGTGVAGRTRAELEGLVGMFVNTLALRADLSGDPPFRELLARVRETTLDAHAHQDLPFERLVEALETGRSPGHAPVVQVMFTLQAAPPAAPALPGLRARVEEIPTATAKFDLTLQLTDTGGEIAGALEYATDLFDAATTERMAEHFRVLLARAAAHPDRPISALSLLSDDERRRVVEQWNATDRAHP